MISLGLSTASFLRSGKSSSILKTSTYPRVGDFDSWYDFTAVPTTCLENFNQYTTLQNTKNALDAQSSTYNDYLTNFNAKLSLYESFTYSQSLCNSSVQFCSIADEGACVTTTRAYIKIPINSQSKWWVTVDPTGALKASSSGKSKL